MSNPDLFPKKIAMEVVDIVPEFSDLWPQQPNNHLAPGIIDWMNFARAKMCTSDVENWLLSLIIQSLPAQASKYVIIDGENASMEEKAFLDRCVFYAAAVALNRIGWAYNSNAGLFTDKSVFAMDVRAYSQTCLEARKVITVALLCYNNTTNIRTKVGKLVNGKLKSDTVGVFNSTYDKEESWREIVTTPAASTPVRTQRSDSSTSTANTAQSDHASTPDIKSNAQFNNDINDAAREEANNTQQRIAAGVDPATGTGAGAGTNNSGGQGTNGGTNGTRAAPPTTGTGSNNGNNAGTSSGIDLNSVAYFQNAYKTGTGDFLTTYLSCADLNGVQMVGLGSASSLAVAARNRIPVPVNILAMNCRSDDHWARLINWLFRQQQDTGEDGQKLSWVTSYVYGLVCLHPGSMTAEVVNMQFGVENMDRNMALWKSVKWDGDVRVIPDEVDWNNGPTAEVNKEWRGANMAVILELIVAAKLTWRMTNHHIGVKVAPNNFRGLFPKLVDKLRVAYTNFPSLNDAGAGVLHDIVHPASSIMTFAQMDPDHSNDFKQVVPVTSTWTVNAGRVALVHQYFARIFKVDASFEMRLRACPAGQAGIGDILAAVNLMQYTPLLSCLSESNKLQLGTVARIRAAISANPYRYGESAAYMCDRRVNVERNFDKQAYSNLISTLGYMVYVVAPRNTLLQAKIFDNAAELGNQIEPYKRSFINAYGMSMESSSKLDELALSKIIETPDVNVTTGFSVETTRDLSNVGITIDANGSVRLAVTKCAIIHASIIAHDTQAKLGIDEAHARRTIVSILTSLRDARIAFDAVYNTYLQ